MSSVVPATGNIEAAECASLIPNATTASKNALKNALVKLLHRARTVPIAFAHYGQHRSTRTLRQQPLNVDLAFSFSGLILPRRLGSHVAPCSVAEKCACPCAAASSTDPCRPQESRGCGRRTRQAWARMAASCARQGKMPGTHGLSALTSSHWGCSNRRVSPAR
jgi:hypothetical protein